MKLSLTIHTDQSTCQTSSYDLYLVAYGRRISPYSKNSSHYQFNGLSSNTSHSIHVSYRNGESTNRVHIGYTNTPAVLRKFPNYKKLCTFT